MATKRHMTVDDLLGPELSSEIGDAKTLGSDEPTLAQGKQAQSLEPKSKPDGKVKAPSESAHKSATDDLFPDLSDNSTRESDAALDSGSDKSLLDNGTAPKPLKFKAPLPPQPGGTMSRGRIPSVTPKKKKDISPDGLVSDGAPEKPEEDGLLFGKPQAAVGTLAAADAEATHPNDGGSPEREMAWQAGDPEHGPVSQDALAAMGRPQFPRDEVRLASHAIGSWFRRLPMGWRIGLVVAPVALVCVLLFLIIVLSRGGSYQAFVTADHTLLAVPAAGVPLPHGDILERNEEVTVLEVAGMFALVSNPEGRTGWVQQSYLSKTAAPVSIDLDGSIKPFTLCFKRYNEGDIEPCKARAEMQRGACVEYCADKSDPTPCQVDCKSHHAKCESTCTMLFHELHAPPPPPPPDPAPEPEHVEAALDPESATVNEETDEDKASKKKRKNKKRKKRKKSR